MQRKVGGKDVNTPQWKERKRVYMQAWRANQKKQRLEELFQLREQEGKRSRSVTHTAVPHRTLRSAGWEHALASVWKALLSPLTWRLLLVSRSGSPPDPLPPDPQITPPGPIEQQLLRTEPPMQEPA